MRFSLDMKQTIRLTLLLAVLTLTGCTNCGNTNDDEQTRAAWQRYHEACQAKDLDRTLVIIDSMETAAMFGVERADYLRAFAYDRAWQMRIAEHYYKKAHEGYAAEPSKNWYDYTDAGYRWAYMRLNRGDVEGALDVTSRLLAQAEGNEDFPKSVQSALLMLMASCQLSQRQYEEAKHSCQMAYETQQATIGDNPSESMGQAITCMNVSINYFETGDTEGAQQWLERCAQELARYEQSGGDFLLIEEWKGHVALQRARYLQATGHIDEAAATYAAIPHSRIFEPNGYTAAADYLMAAGRYNEAAYWYEQLDNTYRATDGAQMNFDNIASRLAPRYSAYRKVGRNADALVLADSICTAIDSALVWQKKSDAAELAVVYQTHERDLQLANLRFSISVHRLMAIALIVIILLIGYLLWRSYQYNKVLAAKNRRLLAEIAQREREEQQAVEQLKAEPEEELTAQQLLFRRICDLMDSTDHIYTDTDLDRNRLAQLLGTNEHYVSDAISACCNGKSVNGFLNEYRLRYAAHLLATTRDSVALIAECSGFARSSFFRVFSEAYGMSPTEYRRAASR